MLFAVYVIRTVRGHEAKKTALKPLVQSPPQVAIVYPKKHHQAVVPIAKKILPKTDTIPAPHPQKPLAVAPQPIADSTYTATIHANITGIVYLHQSPSYNSPVIAKIPDAAQVHVLQQGADYYKIMFNEQEGYVLKSSITKQ